MTVPRWPPDGDSPKLLFVTYTFPPARTAGAVRTWNIAKYLSRAGWSVSVLTPDPSLWRHVDRPEATELDLGDQGIRRLSTGHNWRWLVGGNMGSSSGTLSWFAGAVGRRLLERAAVDGTVGWVRPAKKACSHLVPGTIDVVLASGPTFSAFPLAKRLARQFGVPYVLDYRDLWSDNLHRPAAGAFKREAAVLADSAAVTTVSPSWGSILEQRFGLGARLHIVSNGFDPEQLDGVAQENFGHFAIVYTGSFWPPKRVVSPLMAALRHLDRRGPLDRWMFHYYGKHGAHVAEEARRFGLMKRVVMHGPVSRSIALKAVKGAGVAVVITSIAKTATVADNGMVTGKIFEAIGLERPTLLIAPPGSDARGTTESSGLVRAFAGDEVDGIAAFLGNLMAGATLSATNITAFSWGTIIGSLDTQLRKIIGRA